MNGRDFSFPLNAYAALLQWEEGRADYLHYGLFEHDDEPIHLAQARASERMWAQMPTQGRVLEVGLGLGDTLAALRARGRDALGITPEAAQATAAHQRHGSDLAVAVTPLETLGHEHGRFDVMLFQESAQYIQPLAIFEAADRLLDEQGGTLVVMDEFALRRDSDADFGLHLLPHFKGLAARYGWRVVHDEDVTAQARVTVQVLQALAARWRVRLQAELSLSAEMLDDLDTSLRRYADCYARGVFGYRVLRLQRGAAPALRPLPIDPAHPAQTLALFDRVFGRAMSAAEWQWKYGNGHGRGMSIAGRDGSLVAFYGGLTRPLSLKGQAASGCQVCDVMVHGEAHASLARTNSLARQCAASFLEAEIGYGRRHAVGFGFPTDRALRVAERLGLYERVDQMVQLRWPAHLPAAAGHAMLPLQPFNAAELREGTTLWDELDGLWKAMQAAFPEAALGVRDPAWLRYRYGLKPHVAYGCRLLRSTPGAGAVGLIVFRSHVDHLEVMDVVGDARAGPALIAALRQEYAALQPESSIKAWITLSHHENLLAPGDGVIRDDLDLHIPANAHTDGVPPSALRGRWFLMAGDTDFR